MELSCPGLNVFPRTVADQAIALHFAQAQATVAGSALCWLAGEQRHWTVRSCVHLQNPQGQNKHQISHPKEINHPKKKLSLKQCQTLYKAPTLSNTMCLSF